jgi:hypothetical protein
MRNLGSRPTAVKFNDRPARPHFRKNKFKPHVGKLVDEIRRHGAEPTVSLTGRHHVRIEAQIRGRRVVIFVGSTPSSPLCVNNKRAEIRRKFRWAQS